MAVEAVSLQVEPVTNVQDLCATEFTSHEPQEHYTASTIGDITRTASQKSKINFSSLEWKQILKTSIWHGGTWFDAWITAVAAQVGYHALISSALSSLQLSCGISNTHIPLHISQVGYKYGILFQFVSGAFGCWTVFLLSWMYAELKQRKMLAGTYQKGHILQYHEVIGGLVGKWGHYITKTFILLSLTFGRTLQLIACSSDVHYMNSNWNKRQWLYLFGGLALPCVLIPTLHTSDFCHSLGLSPLASPLLI
ncbi:unnamed protein product [Sphagnum troendelagicum]|uniref:Amino acid transporter transmembrane domain-containing protein n=1 Tax=Sphagnum troendelagicum TaxID=128251 RepID=A0ABP0UZU3_9BRYO